MNPRIIIFLSLALQMLFPKAQAGGFDPIYNPPKGHLEARIGHDIISDSITTYKQFDHFTSSLIDFLQTSEVDSSLYTNLQSSFATQRNGREREGNLLVAISILFICMGVLILSIKYFS